MIPQTLEYRIERIEKDVEAILEKAEADPKSAKQLMISLVVASVAILGSVFAFGDYAIRTRLAPIEAQVDYQYEAIKRIELKLDQLIVNKR